MKLHSELHERYFERVGDLNPEKLSTYLANISHHWEEDFKPGFKEKILRFLKIYLKVINVWSFESQSQLNCQ